MSSHREAPAISRDPVADNTDSVRVRLTRRPRHGHDHLQLPAARGAVRRSELLRVRPRRPLPHQHRQRRRRDADIIYEFAFETQVANPNSFLYNSGPILSIDSANWNRKQFYSVTRITPRAAPGARRRPGLPAVQHRPALDSGLRPAGLASRSTASPGAGPCSRDSGLEGFYVDLGSIFDLGTLRPFEQLHATFGFRRWRPPPA